MISSIACRKHLSPVGAAAVEFAVIAPLFFVLLFGIIEFGRMLWVQQIIVNAAREGARAAVMPGETDAQFSAVVSNYLATAQISGGTASLTPTLSTSPASGTPITATVSVSCASVSFVSSSTWFQGKSLTSSVVMIKE